MKQLETFLFAAIFASSAAASATPLPTSPPAESAARAGDVHIVIQSRTGTDARSTVTYTIAARAFKLTAIRGTTSTLEVTEAGRPLLRVVIHPDGSGQLTNHRGQSYSLAQLKADPTLQENFDGQALAVLDKDVASYLGTGSTVASPCVHPIVFIACAVGGYIALCCDWSAGDDGWDVSCDCPGGD